MASNATMSISHSARRHESGSATVEFVIFGLPLLIASLLFFVTMNGVGIDQSQGRALAREAIHTFVNAKSDQDGYVQVSQILDTYVKERSARLSAETHDFPAGSLTAESPTLHFKVTCQRYPCISPSNHVSLEIFSLNKDGTKRLIASAQSSVSRWVP